MPTPDFPVDTSSLYYLGSVRNDNFVVGDQIEFNDAPMIYLFFYKDVYAVQPWIKGFTVPAVFNGQRWTDVTISK